MKVYFLLILTFINSCSLSVSKTFEIIIDYFLSKISNSKFKFLLSDIFLLFYNFFLFFLINFFLISLFFNHLIIEYKIFLFLLISVFVSLFLVAIRYIKLFYSKKLYLKKKIENYPHKNINNIMGKKNYELSSNKIEYFVDNKKEKGLEIFLLFKSEYLFLLNAYFFLNIESSNFISIDKFKKIICIKTILDKNEILHLKNKNQYKKIFISLFSCGLTGFLINTLNHNNRDIFVGLTKSNIHQKMNFLYYLKKMSDEKNLEKKFQINLINHKITSALEKCKGIMQKRYLTTAYFYNGIGIGNPINSRHGYGKWKLFLQNQIQEYMKNKSIIDFGSNCCILPIYLSSEGKAEKVDCVELHNDNCEAGNEFKKIMEYQLSKNLDMEIHNSDMYQFIKDKEFKYDVATFFCSLYYLEKKQINEVISILSKKVKILIVQANQQTNLLDRAEKSNIDYLKQAVQNNNFNIIKIYNQKHLVRPLFVAKSKLYE